MLQHSNSFGDASARIWRESSCYYLLGYWAVPAGAGRMRAIDIKTTRRDVEVRARRFR